MHAKDQHRRLRCCPKPPNEVQSGEFIAVNAQINDDDIGMEAVDDTDGFGSRICLARRAEAGVLNELTAALGHYRMVVDYQNLGHRGTRTHTFPGEG